MSPEISQDAVSIAIATLKDFETGYLSGSGFINPFLRPGVTVQNMAYACGFWKDSVTKSGRRRADVAAARRLLLKLKKEGLVESTGKHRTMACGSSAVECFALSGFTERLDQAIKDQITS
jgi:hypothetical protein